MNRIRLAIAAAFVAVLLCGACAQLAGVSDWVNENPHTADLVISQSIARYIESSDDQPATAARVEATVATAINYLDGNPTATLDQLLQVVNDSINWDSLSISDRILVQDLIGLVQVQLVDIQVSGELSEDEKIGIRSMLNTIRRTAGYFVE
jgi:hypothetical protein